MATASDTDGAPSLTRELASLSLHAQTSLIWLAEGWLGRCQPGERLCVDSSSVHGELLVSYVFP